MYNYFMGSFVATIVVMMVAAVSAIMLGVASLAARFVAPRLHEHHGVALWPRSSRFRLIVTLSLGLPALNMILFHEWICASASLPPLASLFVLIVSVSAALVVNLERLPVRAALAAAAVHALAFLGLYGLSTALSYVLVLKGAAFGNWNPTC